VRVTFLSGREVVLSDVARNQRITVSEPPTEVPLGGAAWLTALLALLGLGGSQGLLARLTPYTGVNLA
jgi:hypothetical protein